MYALHEDVKTQVLKTLSTQQICEANGLEETRGYHLATLIAPEVILTGEWSKLLQMYPNINFTEGEGRELK